MSRLKLKPSDCKAAAEERDRALSTLMDIINGKMKTALDCQCDVDATIRQRAHVCSLCWYFGFNGGRTMAKENHSCRACGFDIDDFVSLNPRLAITPDLNTLCVDCCTALNACRVCRVEMN